MFITFLFSATATAKDAFENCADMNLFENVKNQRFRSNAADLNFVYTTEETVRFNLTNKMNDTQNLFIYITCLENGIIRFNSSLQDEAKSDQNYEHKAVLKSTPKETKYRNITFEEDRVRINTYNGCYIHVYEKPFVMELFDELDNEIIKMDDIFLFNNTFSMKLTMHDAFQVYTLETSYNETSKMDLFDFENIKDVTEEKCASLKNKNSPIVYPYGSSQMAGLLFNNEEEAGFQIYSMYGQLTWHYMIKNGIFDIFVLSGQIMENIVDQYRTLVNKQ